MATYMSFIVLLSVSALIFINGLPYGRMGMLVLPMGNNAEEPVQPMMIIPFQMGQQAMMPMMPRPMMMNMMPMMNNNANSNSMMSNNRMERPEIKTDAAGRKTLEF